MVSVTLNTIRERVRRITRTPSLAQMSDSQLDDYINNAIVFDFPQHLRTENLRQTLTFYTTPYVDTYSTNTLDVNSPLYNFKNKFAGIHPPAYIAGVPAFFTQYRDVFLGYWPQIASIQDTTLRGDGTAGPFSGTLTGYPVLQNSVNFNCPDVSGQPMILVDYPVVDGNGNVSNSTGALGIPGVPQTTPSPYGSINYQTGAYTLTFPANTQVSGVIYSESVYYQVGKSYSILYFADTFTIRPVPDKVYAVTLEVEVRPIELDSPNTEILTLPNFITQWWQYIAYLAAKKIFEDRMDFDSIQMITPELRKQETLALRTTLADITNQRTTTIYTIGKQYWNGWFSAGWPY